MRWLTAGLLAVVGLGLSGCTETFCQERTLLGFLFCDPQYVSDVRGPVVGIETPDLPFSHNTVVAGQLVRFVAVVEGAGNPLYPQGYIAREQWDFEGDGTFDLEVRIAPGTGQIVSHRYPRGVDAKVTVRVIDQGGRTTEAVARLTVRPTPGNGPVPHFTVAPNPATPGEEVRFDGSGSTDANGRILRWAWDFGDGTRGEPGGPIATHTFASIGQYPVMLQVIDDEGDGSSLVLPVEVVTAGPFPPVASFTKTATANPREFLFDASSSNDRDGSIVAYEWDFDGNGIVDSTVGPQVTHTFPTDGVRNVQLTVRDNSGAADTFTVEVVVYTAPPEVQLTFEPSSPMEDQLVTFTATITTPGRTGTGYQWDLDGDTTLETDTGAENTASYSYEPAGTYHVTVQVTDNASRTVMKSVDVVVSSVSSPGGARSARVRPPPARRFFATLDVSRMTAPAGVRGRGSTRRAAGVTGSGSLRGQLLPATGNGRVSASAALRGFVRSTWRTRLDLASLASGRRQRVGGYVLATPRRRGLGRACVLLRLRAQPGRRPTGSYTVVGGRGAAGRLRVSGRLGLQLRGDGRATVAGTVRVRRPRSRPTMPRACRRLG